MPTKTKRSTASSNGAGAKRPTSKKTNANGTSARSGSAQSAGSKKRSASSARSSQAKSRARPKRSQPASNGSNVDAAVGRTKAAGRAVAGAAAKAKTPLIVGGTALVGVAAGAIAKNRLGSRSHGPLKRIGQGIGKSASKLGKLDLDTVKTTAEKVNSYSRQASDIAAAAEKTRKKNG
jgi:hypothetical protein